MSTVIENQTTSLYSSHFGFSSVSDNQENQQHDSLAWNFFFSLLSVVLSPFYVIGLFLKMTISFIISPIKTGFYLMMYRRFPPTENNEDIPHISLAVDSPISRRSLVSRTPSPVRSATEANKKEHSKFVVCPTCKHLHYSSSYCKCKYCVKNKPKLIECLKYHKKDAQLLMCPCIDCKHQRPMSEVCEHCVMVSQKVHVQAKTPEDIEIRTRPKREKHL